MGSKKKQPLVDWGITGIDVNQHRFGKSSRAHSAEQNSGFPKTGVGANFHEYQLRAIENSTFVPKVVDDFRRKSETAKNKYAIAIKFD